MATLKLRRIGNSVGVVLPKEILARLKVGAGDELHVVDTADGVRLVTHDPAFAEQMERARAIMRRRRNVLRELAK
jgi:putative addiction module antidote